MFTHTLPHCHIYRDLEALVADLPVITIEIIEAVISVATTTTTTSETIEMAMEKYSAAIMVQQ